MTIEVDLKMVRKIMGDFAAATGLLPPGPEPRRYLWTDAFAVANFIELYRQTGEEEYRDLALRLVAQVHLVLGRHRPDDARGGWLSGLSEEEGGRHPTLGGLRIGKPLPERGPNEPVDQQLEWERDGQYYHYLVKWLRALLLVGRVTSEPRYCTWGRELARTMHARFLRPAYPGGPTGIAWKMSLDLTRPLVAGMGQHDALDGWLAYLALQSGLGTPDLDREIGELAALCRHGHWGTDDPLGLGGLLDDAWQTGQLIARGGAGLDQLLPTLLAEVLPGLAAYARGPDRRRHAAYRLAFRELGLSIGLQAAARLADLFGREPARFAAADRLRGLLAQVLEYQPLGDAIVRFWLDPENQAGGSWQEHREINRVMLATSLAPGAFLGEWAAKDRQGSRL
ncbi:MAG TPA: hypothetical protein VLA15_00030 [Desulfurivibrionaceae bacterium]|nr:hypothetical protein [Desulfurivibrionaceae bacterium]